MEVCRQEWRSITSLAYFTSNHSKHDCFRCPSNFLFQNGDEGIYECRAYRKDEVIASTSVHVYADSHLPADVARVEIAAPTVRVVNKGDSIVLDCVVSG